MFVFYDTETTGTDTYFSQIVQIGLLFTDDDLNVLSTKKADCRHSPWTLPSPGAMLTTGFTPDDMKTRKTTNYEMMQDVGAWLHGQHWPVTFVGYNSINYDEPVLSENLFQNLLDPGLTMSGNDKNDQTNGRADVMYLVEATALYMPGVLNLKELNYYKLPSLTLKAVARQNGVSLSDEDAHDALNDIKATVGVAKVIKRAAPQIWEQMNALSTAKGVDAFLAKHDIFTYANTDHYDQIAHKPAAMEATVATSLGSVGGTGEILVDLRVDPAVYLDASVDELKDMFLSKSRQRPLGIIAKEKQPVLMPIELSDSVLTETDDIAAYEKRAKSLKGNAAFMARLTEAAALAQKEFQAALPSGCSEMQIDNAVAEAVKPKLESWIKAFNGANDWHERAALVKSYRETFKEELAADPSLDRFVRLAGRLVFEHAPEELTAEMQDAMKKFIAGRILNPDLKAPYMTIAKARKELSTIEWLRSKPDSDKWKDVTDSQIRCLKLYYTALEKEYAAYSPYPPPAGRNAANSNAPNATRKDTAQKNGTNGARKGFNRNTPKS